MSVSNFTQPRGLKNWWAGAGGLKDQLNSMVSAINTLIVDGVTSNLAFSSYVFSSATSITLSTLSNVNSITFTASGQTLRLPSATSAATVFEGGVYGFYNSGAESFDIDDNGDNLIKTLPVGESVIIGCVDDSTAAGTWVVLAEDFDFTLSAFTQNVDGSNFSIGATFRPFDSLDAAQTFALADAGRLQRLTGSTNRIWTVPANAAVAFVTGTEIEAFNDGTGELTFTADTGVTINGVTAGSITLTANQGGVLKKVDTDRWIYMGDAKGDWA